MIENGLSKRDKTLRTIGIVLNIIWVIIIIPASAMFFAAGVATIMMTDDGTASDIFIIIIMIITCLFWAVPVAAIISVVLSFWHRKKGKYALSVIVQSIPLAIFIILLAFLFFI